MKRFLAIALVLSGCATTATIVDEDHGGSRKLGKHGVLAYWSGVYSLSLEFIDQRTIRINGTEEDQSRDAYEYWSRDIQLTHDVEAISGRHANEFYVVGKDGTDTVIDRWDLSVENGAYYTTSAPPGDPIGTSVRTQTARLAVSGSYQPPGLRPAPTVTPTRLHVGPSVGRVQAASIDPDGRYLLMVCEDTSTSTYSLTRFILSTGVVETVLTAAQEPDLDGVTGFGHADQSTLGRIHTMNAHGNVIWLADTTNDGVIDSHGNLELDDFMIAYPDFSFTHY